MSTFHDALERKIAVALDYDDFIGNSPSSENIAVAVLSMPEMEAIRNVLRDNAEYFDATYASPLDALIDWELPESVIDWVMDGET